jgi:hypothetical protein
MRENLTYGLMRGRWRRAVGLLDRDTRPKGEKRPGVAGPGRYRATAPLYQRLDTFEVRGMYTERLAPTTLTHGPGPGAGELLSRVVD